MNLDKKLRIELADLKEKHGPDRKFKKTDACYGDFNEYKKVQKEKKLLEEEMKAKVMTIKKNALAQLQSGKNE